MRFLILSTWVLLQSRMMDVGGAKLIVIPAQFLEPLVLDIFLCLLYLIKTYQTCALFSTSISALGHCQMAPVQILGRGDMFEATQEPGTCKASTESSRNLNRDKKFRRIIPHVHRSISWLTAYFTGVETVESS